VTKAATFKPTPAVGDAEIVARLATGDLDALGMLYDRHAHDVRRFVHRLGVAPHDVDDLTQGVFLEAVRAAARFDGRPSARGWLLGVAAIMVRRHRRSVGRRVRQLATWVTRPQSAPVTPAETLDAAGTHERLARALENLSPQKREVFLLVVAEGLSADQVASALGIPVATVWTRLHYARTEIRRQMGEDVA
jgi:RNA polymerase sigma factor (sigma-70 family)